MSLSRRRRVGGRRCSRRRRVGRRGLRYCSGRSRGGGVGEEGFGDDGRNWEILIPCLQVGVLVEVFLAGFLLLGLVGSGEARCV